MLIALVEDFLSSTTYDILAFMNSGKGLISRRFHPMTPISVDQDDGKKHDQCSIRLALCAHLYRGILKA